MSSNLIVRQGSPSDDFKSGAVFEATPLDSFGIHEIPSGQARFSLNVTFSERVSILNPDGESRIDVDVTKEVIQCGITSDPAVVRGWEARNTAAEPAVA